MLASIKKLISADRNAPHPMTIGPRVNVAVCHAPPGINGVKMGMMMLLTNACTSVVAAVAMTNATANPSTLYSLMNNLNSWSIFMTSSFSFFFYLTYRNVFKLSF